MVSSASRVAGPAAYCSSRSRKGWHEYSVCSTCGREMHRAMTDPVMLLAQSSLSTVDHRDGESLQGIGCAKHVTEQEQQAVERFAVGALPVSPRSSHGKRGCRRYCGATSNDNSAEANMITVTTESMLMPAAWPGTLHPHDAVFRVFRQ